MTEHSFDKFIKDKLSDYSSPVPEGLWEKIQQEKDKKPTGLLWWKNYGYLGFVGVAALLVCTTIFFNKNNANKTIASNSLHKSRVRSNLGSSAQTNSDQYEISKIKPQSSENNQTGNASSQGVLTDERVNDKETQVTASSSASSMRRKSPAIFQSPVRNNSIAKGEFKSGNGDERMTSVQQKSFNPGTYNKKAPAKESIRDYTAAILLNKPVFLATIQNDKNLDKLSGNDYLKTLKDIKLVGMDNCPSARGPVRNDYYIEVYGSPDYVRKTVSNVSSNIAFLQRKDSTENMRLSYTAGFRLSKNIGENLLIKSGLQYSQINEKFTYRSENERKLTTVITIRTVIRPAGDTVFVRDTSTVEQIGYRVKTTYNRYRSLDLPLLIGYEWGNDNLKAVVSGGVILNLYSWQKGESIDTSYVPVAFNKGSGQTFKQNIGLGLYAGMSLLKKVGERSEFFMEPYFRYNISNMTNNKSLYNQKFQVAGINMGVRYKLNGFRQR